MQRTIPTLLAFFLLLIASAYIVQAHWDCLPSSCQRIADGERSPYWNADVVFVGFAEKSFVEGEAVLTEFRISRPIRGITGAGARVFTSGSPCAFQFKEEEHYFVYATQGDDGKLGVSACFPPVLLKDAAEDLEYAGEIAAGQLGTRIFGSVLERSQASLGTRLEMVPLEGIPVTIKGEAGAFGTRTNKRGKYVFKNIPPGRYEVIADLPGNLRNLGPSKGYLNIFHRPVNIAVVGESIKPVDILSPVLDQNLKEEKYFRYWDTVNFTVSSLNSIAGKVRNFDGSVPPQEEIHLLLVDGEGKVSLDPMFHQWSNPESGAFVFDDLPNGKYVVAVNPANCHGPRNPGVGQAFFPGVVDNSRAQQTTLSGSQEVQLIDFQLPPLLKEREIKGRVVSEGGDPVKNAWVYLLNSSPHSYPCHTGRVAETTTDWDGRFLLRGYEGYRYELRAYKMDGNVGSEMRHLRSFAVEIPAQNADDEIKLIARPSY